MRADEHDLRARFSELMPLHTEEIKQGRFACPVRASEDYEVAQLGGLGVLETPKCPTLKLRMATRHCCLPVHDLGGELLSEPFRELEILD